MITRHTEDFKWEDVSVLAYQETGTNFKSITRQILFNGLGDLPCQLRYFEVQPDGYSSLEYHEHVHLVLILRGKGEVFLGDSIRPVNQNDVITVPPSTWHQFKANRGDHLGFLCLVNVERDKSKLPTEADLLELRKNPEVAAFIRS